MTFKPGDRVEVRKPWGDQGRFPGPGTVAKVSARGRVTVNWDSRPEAFTQNKAHYKPEKLKPLEDK